VSAATATAPPSVLLPPPSAVSTASPAASIADTTVAGTWNGTWINSPDFGKPQATGNFSVTFTVNGTTLTGVSTVSGKTCVKGGTSTGTVVGNNISFGFLSDPTRPVQFEGAINGNTMSGTWSATACPPLAIQVYGTWEATKASGASPSP
jgi:hypothetical protein